jgi:pimeloyl-ACP methyl ester carboxylesterase
MSMGGYLSLLFQLQHPRWCTGIVMVDCGPGFKKDEARESWNVQAAGRAETFEKGGLEALDRTRTEIRDAQHRDATGLALAARGILTQKNDAVISGLSAIDIPALVVVGEHDVRFLPGSNYMAKKIPNAELYVIPGAGHAANMDQSKLFNSRIRSFLAKNGI